MEEAHFGNSRHSERHFRPIVDFLGMIAVALHEPTFTASRADLGYALLQREPRAMDTHPQGILSDCKVGCDPVA